MATYIFYCMHTSSLQAVLLYVQILYALAICALFFGKNPAPTAGQIIASAILNMIMLIPVGVIIPWMYTEARASLAPDPMLYGLVPLPLASLFLRTSNKWPLIPKALCPGSAPLAFPLSYLTCARQVPRLSLHSNYPQGRCPACFFSCLPCACGISPHA